MREPGDPEPMYVKTWEQWERVCEMRGVPRDYLNEGMVRLMRLGLRRNGRGDIIGESEHSADSLLSFREEILIKGCSTADISFVS
jgi:hypothetical protein